MCYLPVLLRNILLLFCCIVYKIKYKMPFVCHFHRTIICLFLYKTVFCKPFCIEFSYCQQQNPFYRFLILGKTRCFWISFNQFNVQFVLFLRNILLLFAVLFLKRNRKCLLVALFTALLYTDFYVKLFFVSCFV